MARPKCLMRNFTYFNRIYKAHWINVWWTMKVIRLHWTSSIYWAFRAYNLNTVMSLLEAPCTKTSWQALLFRAILGITGALIGCFVIWWFKQVNNGETGFGGHHCDFEQHVSCLTVHVCMNSVKLVLEAPSAYILWGRYYSVTMCRLIWGALLLGRALLIGTLRYMYFDMFQSCKFDAY